MTEADYLREQARNCEVAARKTESWQDIRALRQLALYYQDQASRASRAEPKGDRV